MMKLADSKLNNVFFLLDWASREKGELADASLFRSVSEVWMSLGR